MPGTLSPISLLAIMILYGERTYILKTSTFLCKRCPLLWALNCLFMWRFHKYFSCNMPSPQLVIFSNRCPPLFPVCMSGITFILHCYLTIHPRPFNWSCCFYLPNVLDWTHFSITIVTLLSTWPSELPFPIQSVSKTLVWSHHFFI